MTKSTQTNDQQGSTTGFFIWLSRNMIPVVILFVLVVGGIFAFLIKDLNISKEVPKEVSKAETPKSAGKDRQASRYALDDCTNDPHCRQFKRIEAEGGASREAIRRHMLAADKTVTFEQLQENASRYEGTPWVFEGKIFDILWQEKRGTGNYILADIIIGDDPSKQLSVKGDFATDFAENDYVYVVGYITGTSHPRFGPNPHRYGNVPSLSARALLKPGEATDLLKVTGTN
jgi:hypothetical protein